MEKMRELYEKVAKDSALQAKYAAIMKAAENTGIEETGKQLVAFAKEEGYAITVDEIRDFFGNLEPPTESALSEEELDAVAGGKVMPELKSAGANYQGCEVLLTTNLNYSMCRYNFI